MTIVSHKKLVKTNWGQKSAEVETGSARADCLVLLEDNVTKSVTELSKIVGRGVVKRHTGSWKQNGSN